MSLCILTFGLFQKLRFMRWQLPFLNLSFSLFSGCNKIYSSLLPFYKEVNFNQTVCSFCSVNFGIKEKQLIIGFLNSASFLIESYLKNFCNISQNNIILELFHWSLVILENARLFKESRFLLLGFYNQIMEIKLLKNKEWSF